MLIIVRVIIELAPDRPKNPPCEIVPAEIHWEYIARVCPQSRQDGPRTRCCPLIGVIRYPTNSISAGNSEPITTEFPGGLFVGEHGIYSLSQDFPIIVRYAFCDSFAAKSALLNKNRRRKILGKVSIGMRLADAPKQTSILSNAFRNTSRMLLSLSAARSSKLLNRSPTSDAIQSKRARHALHRQVGIERVVELLVFVE